MSRKDNLIKSKSIYTIRKKHQTVSTGTIYENDHVTIIQNDGIFNEDMPLFSDSNFKFRIRTGFDGKKKHARYGWITNNFSENQVWTLSSMPTNKISEETKIVQKPNYQSLRDFAYYGSAVELVKATVNDIIMRYPGGISYYYCDDAPEIWIGGERYYLISNEFNIDFWTPKGVSIDELENPMRVIGASYMNYEDGEGNDINLTLCITGNCPDSIIGKVSFSNFYDNTEREDRQSYKSKMPTDFVLGGPDDFEDEGERGGDSLDSASTQDYTVLTVTAYTKSQNNVLRPIPFTNVTFYSYSLKDCTEYRKTTTTNANGVATVRLGPNQGWVLINGENTIESTSYWTASINYNNETHFIICGDEPRINCTGECAKSLTTEQDGEIVCQQTDKQIFVSAYTINENNSRLPIRNEFVEFHLYNSKACYEFSAKVLTDSYGVARQYVGEQCGWELVNGGLNSDIYDCDFWTAYMTYNGETESGHTGTGTISCNGIRGNDLLRGDNLDEISFNNIPSFKYLKVYTLCEEDSFPISNSMVWIEATTSSGCVFGTSGYTNRSGYFTAFNDITNWYIISILSSDRDTINNIVSWTANTNVNGEIITSSLTISQTEVTMYYDCGPDYPYDCVTVYTYLKASDNTPFLLSGANATIVISDGKTTKEYTGTTDSNGSFTVCFSACTGFTGQINSWNCYATYSGVTVYGEQFAINQHNLTNNSQNLCFEIEEEEPIEYDLIVTAYTRNQVGTTTPIINDYVTFYAYIRKCCAIYSKNVLTDENGVARVKLGEGYGWRHVSGNDEGVQYSDYWCASIGFNGQTIFGSNASILISPCEEEHYVNGLQLQQYEDVIICNYTARKLIASAFTVMQTGNYSPIIGEPVEFHAFVSKSCSEYVVTANTNSNGVASVYLSDGEGWEHVPNTESDSIQYCDYWRCCMAHESSGQSGTTMHGTISCNNLLGNSLATNDYTDLILFDFTPSFEFLKINVLCEDSTPIPNVSVWIIATTNKLESFRIDGYTNENGEFVAYNDMDSGWYFLGPYVHALLELNDVVKWTAYANFGGEQQMSNEMQISNNEYTFNFSCDPTYILSCLTVYAFSGLPGNSNPIQNAIGTIRLYNDKGQYVDFTGRTGQNGGYSICLDDEHLSQLNGKTASSWWCAAEHNGNHISGRTIEITEGYYQNYQNLYFSGETPQNGIKLTASAYTVSNGVKTPIQNEIVSFYVKSESSDSVGCIKTARTNSNGIAHVYLSEPGWQCDDSYVLNNPSCWYVTMSYNGTVESGITTTNCNCAGTILPRTNPIKTKTTDEINFVLNNGEWEFCNDEVVVYAIFEDGSPAVNVPVSVSAKTPYGGSFWIGGRTDENGVLILHASSNWRRLNTGTYGDIYSVSMFSACGVYNSQTECDYIDKVGGGSCSMTLRFRKKLEPIQADCGDINGDYEWFDIYMDGDGNKKLVTTCKKCGNLSHDDLVIIRPKKQFREEFWESLDDFERVLLDRDSVPVYKSKFETPYTINNIYYFTLKNYIWPTIDGETPDLTTSRFQGYIKSLIELAEYHDEFDSDNLWRMMTHESIKNLDWTFMRQNDAYDREDVSLDSTRMRGMISIYGRFFDDLKRYADNIKNSNCITYDEKNNLPDYFLTDKVEIGGFEAKSVTSFSALTAGDVYGTARNSTTQQVFTEEFGKTLSMVNSDFMRRLAINEVYIQSMKGTRRGLQSILGLFGYFENITTSANQFTTIAGKYDIHEYIAVANEFPLYKDAATLRGFTENIIDFGKTEEMTGYPVAVVSPGIENATEDDYYLIPWYTYNADYKYPFYFQENGGWGRMYTKCINEPITNASSITEEYEVRIYKETEPYITFVRDIEALKSISNNKVFENMVCYVTDITDMYDEYVEDSTQVGRGSVNNNPNGTLTNSVIEPDYSHYFVLKNVALSNYIGFVDNELYHCYGWKNVHLREFEGQEPTTGDGLRVLYLESLVENGKDNNPHTGKGNYDDGNSYLEKYNFLFGDDFNRGMFDHLKESGEEYLQYYESAQTVGFSLSGMVENNKKCYYFEDSQTAIESRAASSQQQQDVQVGPNNWAEDVYTLIPVGEEDEYDYNDYESFVNPENGEKTDEAAANSIVNVKNLVINFGTSGNKYMKKYIENVVMPYLEHMIPSTAVLKYMFDGVFAEIEIGNITHEHISSTSIVADMVTVDENATYLFENNENII